MILSDGINAMWSIIALGALPFVIVVLILVVCLFRALQAEGKRRDGWFDRYRPESECLPLHRPVDLTHGKAGRSDQARGRYVTGLGNG
ncbi:MAG: hypothetical protein AAF409_08795 [Pseudomonadota bacterium]